MKKNFILFSILFLTSGIALTARSPDQVLRKHYKVMGQEQLARVNAIKATGRITTQGMEFTVVQYMERPDHYRIEGTHEQLTFLQVYNGKEGWNQCSFYDGRKEVLPFTEEEKKSIGYTADMDGLLWNWKSKGFTVSLVGKAEVEGIRCYQLQLTTRDKDCYTYYIDCSTYLLHCISQASPANEGGSGVQTQILLSDYRLVDGINLAFKTVTKVDGEVASVLVIDQFEINPVISTTTFSKPMN